jgi:hypothetical protein
MTVAQYTNDLADVDLADVGGADWVEPSATGWTSVSQITQEDADNYIQGACSNTCLVKSGVGGLITAAKSNTTVPTDGAVLNWMFAGTPAALGTEAQGGMRVIIGNSDLVFKAWSHLGSDSYPYSGWVCLATNDTVSADYTVGSTPASPWQRFGCAVNVTGALSRGFPFAFDAIRVGRCEARFQGGTAPDAAATFEGFRSLNDATSARWGLIQGIEGGLKWQGLMVLGYSAALRMVDSNVNIVVANTKKVTSNFNTIEVRQATSDINWTNVNITALGIVSRGRWITTDNATVALTQCTFTDMATFGFQSNTTCTGCTFRRCDTITPVGGKLLGCRIEASRAATDTSAVVWNNTNPSGYLDNCTFVKGASNTNHAIQFPTDCPDSITLPGVTFSGYNASDGQNDSAIHILRTTGQVTINCAALPSVKSAGATIVKVGTSVTVTVYAKDIGGNNVNDARVLLKAANDTGPFPFEETVTSISNSGTTATVSHTGHGMATGDKVLINGASHWQNNGVFSITKDNDNQYHYTLPSDPGSSPTGTIKATFVALEGLTSSGFLSTSREYSSPQPVTGWIRKAPVAGPWYKPAPLTGTIPSSGEFTTTGVMISDE